MAWIESHQDIGQHPKTYALATALNGVKLRNIPQAVGILHLLWHFTLKFAWRDGDLKRFSSSQIATGLHWYGKPEKLIKALQSSGWLDETVVHDWMDYAGKVVRDRIYNEQRRNTPLNDVNLRKTTATLPDPTVPNHKKRAHSTFSIPKAEEVTAYGASIGFKIDGSAFCDFYESKGWKIGNSPMKSWKAAVRTWKKRDATPVKGEVVASFPGVKLAPGQDPWKEAFEESEKEFTEEPSKRGQE